ncbi:hypothetical protein ACIRO3_05465 [Streptomyces sp. NPDC102278]|uniref:hypothetical protein n=1 Tax=Streptomyces sp. NPDC102278 TaxID=3366152 RepID=UPI00380A7EA7
MPNPQMNTAPDGATSSLTVLLPLVTIMPALTAMFADRLSTPTNVILIVLDLALVAVAAGCFARSAAARAAADRARRDENVLDALDHRPGNLR